MATFIPEIDLTSCTDDADYTRLWNSLRESISLVKSGKPCPGQGANQFLSRVLIQVLITSPQEPLDTSREGMMQAIMGKWY